MRGRGQTDVSLYEEQTVLRSNDDDDERGLLRWEHSSLTDGRTVYLSTEPINVAVDAVSYLFTLFLHGVKVIAQNRHW